MAKDNQPPPEPRPGANDAGSSELEQIIYAVSHDFGAPLRQIEGFAKLLALHRDLLPADGQRNLDFLVASAKRSNHMLAGLLTYSRLNTHRAAPAEVKLSELLAAVFHLAQSRNQRADEESTPPPKLELHLNVDTIVGDMPQLRTVLSELLGNCFKHAEGQLTTIKVSTELATNAGQTSIELRVEDDGPGVPAERHHQLFRLFGRSIRGQQSSGCTGLAIVRRFCELQGGSACARPKDGPGFEVCLSWPLPESQPLVLDANA